MGCPFGSTQFPLPNFVSFLFHSLGLYQNLLDPQSPSPARLDSIPGLARTSISGIQELLLPVMRFSELAPEHHPPPPESCAVCLCDFEGADEVRQLANCHHVFHRRCLDPWMDEDLFVTSWTPSHDATGVSGTFSVTPCTGPGTCPLCRAPFVPG